MKFAEALLALQEKRAKGMRLPKWEDDVIIKIQYPDQESKMTHPYLYVESRYGCVPWKETVPEMFDETWEVVEKSNDIKDKLITILQYYANQTACVVEYDWSDEFSKEFIKVQRNNLADTINSIIDFNELTDKDAKLLGFKKWANYEDVASDIDDILNSVDLSQDEKSDRINKLENTIDLRLIPIYLLPIIPIGTELIGIDGEVIVYNGNNIDTDNRYGCLAYGLKFKEEK